MRLVRNEEQDQTWRILMALVRKAGGQVTLTQAEIFDGGALSLDFNPPLRKDGNNLGQKVILTWSPGEESGS